GRDVVAPEDGIRRAAPAMVRRRADPVGARHPARSPHARARLDRRPRSGASAPPARARRARSRETHLGARLSGAVGARARGPRRKTRAGMRVTMLVRCLAMMRGGGETRHLAWARELTALGVDVDIIAGRPLLFGGPRFARDTPNVSLLRSPYTRDFVYRRQRRRGFGRLTSALLHADEEWFCRAAWRRIASRAQKPDVVHAH